jgi:hypothetical protein
MNREVIKTLILKSCKPGTIFMLKRWDLRLKEFGAINRWERAGRPAPPPHPVKRKIIADFQSKFSFDTLIETGTFLGMMVSAQKERFKKIVSIELDQNLYADARRRFADYSQVEILQGDSGSKLVEVVSRLNGKALFWLDGHYSGGFTARGALDCPIYGELDAIFESPYPHVVLIDDARCFDGTQSYPKIEELREYLIRKAPEYSMMIDCDIIRMVPGTP